MDYWDLGLVSNLLGLALCLAAAGWLRRRLPFWRRLGIPDAFIAGGLGLALGPGGLGVPPFDTATLEAIVYHAFGLMFVAISLQRPPTAASGDGTGRRPVGVRIVALTIPTTAILQILLGFLLVAILAVAGFRGVHPGLALLVMLGFSQGPGQALSLGSAWEPLGLPDGSQLGLAFAASGFVFCGLIGVPLVAWGRRRGWISGPVAAPGDDEQSASTTPPVAEGRMDRLTGQVVAIGCVYAATYGVLWLLAQPFRPDHPLRATLWGFHFITGALIAIGVRRLSIRARFDDVFDDVLLGRLSVVAVDFTTAAAITALLPSVMAASIVALLTLSLGVAGLSVVISLWLGGRAFGEHRFEHAVALFGASTGTLATGLALLRSIDPELRSPAARHMVLGAAASVPFMAPLVAGVLPFSVSLWPQGLTYSLLIPSGILVVYLGALAVGWRVLTPLRPRRPWRRLWPDEPHP